MTKLIRNVNLKSKEVMKMSSLTYYRVTGVIFGVVALFHLLRLVLGWGVNIGPYNIPVWASLFGLVVAGYLSYLGCVKFGKWI